MTDKAGKPRLTLSMVVKNERGRYLQRALERHRQYIDDAVIIDDGSTDGTDEICLRALDGIPVKLVRNEVSKFDNEVTLRKQQWEETIAENPEWILNLDADEWFEDRFADGLGALLAQSETDLWSFRLYDFWSETHYREDQLWRAHFYYRPLLVRYRPEFACQWRETAQHSGRFPDNLFALPNAISPLRLKHFGWAAEADRSDKFLRYMQLDPDGVYGSKEQYFSIMDEQPNLVEFREDEG